MEQWSLVGQFGTIKRDFVSNIIPLSESTFIITGKTITDNASDDWVFLKMNTNGIITMNKSWGANDHDDELLTAILTSDNNIVACGVSGIPGPNQHVGRLMKIDTLGGLIWAKTFDHGNSSEVFVEVRETQDGYLMSGFTNAIESSGSNVFLTKVDFNGNLLWSFVYDEGQFSSGNRALEVLDNNEIIIVDQLQQGDDNDILLIKVNSTGSVVWAKKFGGPGKDICRFVKQANDGGILVGGYTNSFGFGVMMMAYCLKLIPLANYYGQNLLVGKEKIILKVSKFLT